MDEPTEFSTSGTLGDVFIVLCKLYGYYKRTGNRVRLTRYSRYPELDGVLGRLFALAPYAEYVTPSVVVESDINSVADCERLAQPHITEYWDGDGRGNFPDDPRDVVFEPYPELDLSCAPLPGGTVKVGIQLFAGKIGGNFKGFSLGWIGEIRDWLPRGQVDVYLFGTPGAYDHEKIHRLCDGHSIINKVGQLDFIDWLRHIKAMDFFVTPEGFSAFFAMSQKVKTLAIYTDYGIIGRIPPEWRRENIILSAGWRGYWPRVVNVVTRGLIGRYPLLRPVAPEIVYSLVHSNFSFRDGRELHSYWFGKRFWPLPEMPARFARRLAARFVSAREKHAYSLLDCAFIYSIRCYRRLFQRRSLPQYAIVEPAGQDLPREVVACLEELLKQPAKAMDRQWRITLSREQGRNFILHALVRATGGNVLELGRDRGRSLALGVEAFDAEHAGRCFVSVDPVKLDLLESDFVSPMCRGGAYGVNRAEDQRDLPEGFQSVLVRRHNKIRAVLGFSYEKEVREYAARFAPYDIILFDACWVEDSDTYEAVMRDFQLYAPLLRAGGYLLITNAFDLRFQIHRCVAEVLSSRHDFALIRLDRLGLFKDRNSCLLGKK